MKKYNIGWKCSECNVLSALLCYSTRSDHILSKLGFSRSICPKLLHAAHTDPLTRVNQLDLSQWPAWASKNYKSAKKRSAGFRGLSRDFAEGPIWTVFSFAGVRGISRDFADGLKNVKNYAFRSAIAILVIILLHHQLFEYVTLLCPCF